MVKLIPYPYLYGTSICKNYPMHQPFNIQGNKYKWMNLLQ